MALSAQASLHRFQTQEEPEHSDPEQQACRNLDGLETRSQSPQARENESEDQCNEKQFG